MGTRNKSNLAFRGFASVSAFLLAFTSFGSVCAESYASQVNSFLGVKTTKMVSDTDTRIIYASSYGDFTEDNLKKLEADVYDHIEREEEEGAVLLSNDGTKSAYLGLLHIIRYITLQQQDREHTKMGI